MGGCPCDIDYWCVTAHRDPTDHLGMRTCSDIEEQLRRDLPRMDVSVHGSKIHCLSDLWSVAGCRPIHARLLRLLTQAGMIWACEHLQNQYGATHHIIQHPHHRPSSRLSVDGTVYTVCTQDLVDPVTLCVTDTIQVETTLTHSLVTISCTRGVTIDV